MARIDKVVVIVLDGLRPDMIESRMPRLHRFASEALWFREARSVFPSVTRTATTSTATGAWPGSHGIIDNAFHQPALRAGGAIDTSRVADLALLREAQGSDVTCSSLGQCLAAHGKRLAVVHGGTPGASRLLNHTAATGEHWTFSAHGADATPTPVAVARAIARCGALPELSVPRHAVVEYAARVLERLALDDDQPDVSILWLPEPDTSYHYRQIGSDITRTIMSALDDVFARLVDRVRGGRHGASTAIVAMSDHGQISIARKVDLGARLSADGLAASDRPDRGTAIALTRGMMGELRLLEHGQDLLRRTVDWLMQCEDIGMVLARDDLAGSLPGTLPMSSVHHFHERSPELYYVMRSDETPDAHGLPGRGSCTGGPPVGGGMHGGLNRHEMNTVLIVDAPGGRRGEIDTSPAALVDLAPTILSWLGIEAARQPTGRRGRVLPVFRVDTERTHEETVVACHGAFHQQLVRRRIGQRLYLDRGGRCD